MNEGAALRVLSFLNDTSQRHLTSLANEKRKVTVIGEEHEPDEFLEEEEPSEDVINADDTDLLTPQQIKEFFKATEDGSIQRLDELFDATTNADPNMTNYTESLLMAAIRAKRHKVAEYLIDQLAINVNHTTELIEFHTQTRIPIRERMLSCRDLAYDRGMMDLVDLIDISSDEVKPSIKRYLQRRLKTRLDEIHQAYLKRLKERSYRLIIQAQERENQLFEDDELGKENEESSGVNITDDNSLPSPPKPAIVHRPYKSYIEETIQNIQSKDDGSIDESGRKTFRFTGYSLHFRLVETKTKKQQTTEQSRPKSSLFSFPIIPPMTAATTRTFPPSPPLSRPTTTATAINMYHPSIGEISTQIPIRETRASISRSARSARRLSVPPVVSTANSKNKSDIKPTITTTQRLLPKRIHQMNTNYGYIPQLQNTLYNKPRHFMPVTLKATAIGLPSDTRFIRD